MQDHTRVIKRTDPGAGVVVSFDQPLPATKGVRILKHLVEPSSDSLAAEPEKVHRVIRARDSRLNTQPVQLDSRDFLRNTAQRTGENLHKSAKTASKPKTVESLKEEWDAQWQQRLDTAVAAARDEAFALGYTDAHARLQQDYEAQKDVLGAHFLKLRAAWKQFLEESEPSLVELSFDIAQAVLDSPLPGNVKNVATRALAEAVEQLAGSAPIEIMLHPVDFLSLQESGLVDQLESLHAGIRWEPRPEMKQGDWAVQSPAAAIRRLESELIGTLRSRLGLLAVVGKRSTGEQNHPPPSVSRGSNESGSEPDR
jgi:flagellar assembly protein FliH